MWDNVATTNVATGSKYRDDIEATRRTDQRKDIYIEHRASKAARLASWRKMTHPGEVYW
jgi:hypothetical protein